MAVATMLVGIGKATGGQFQLQPVDPKKEQTPDVRTMRMVAGDGGQNLMEVQEVEVVTLEGHSHGEEIDDFLKQTKLSGMKAYPEKMVILCLVDTAMKRNRSWRQIHASLIPSTVPNDVYVLVRTQPNKQVYQLVKVHPMLEIVEFDVMAELLSGPSQQVTKPRRGTVAVTQDIDEVNLPF